MIADELRKSIVPILLASNGVCLATEDKPIIGVHAYYGTSQISGDLSKDSGARTFGTSVSIAKKSSIPDGKLVGGLGGFFSIDFRSISSSKPETIFPFSSEHRISIFTTSLTPTFCVMAELPVQVCGGIGFDKIEVRQKTINAQSYGNFGYTLAIGHFLKSGLNGGLKATYSSVEQTVNENKSSFDLLSIMLSTGWQFQP